MNKGLAVFFIVLVLGLWFAVSVGGAFARKNDLAERVAKKLVDITKDNHDEIKNWVVAEAQSLNIPLTAADVRVGFEPTAQTTVAQNFVSKLADFENYRAEIIVYAPARAWGITVSSEPINRWQTVQVRATSKRNAELEKALRDTDEAVSGAQQPADQQPAPPPARGDPLGRARELQNLQNKQVQQLDQ